MGGQEREEISYCFISQVVSVSNKGGKIFIDVEVGNKN